MERPYRLAVVISHPIQYFVPLFRRLAAEDWCDLTVFYMSKQGVEEYVDPGFGRALRWDVDLLSGYKHEFLPNWSWSETLGGFLSAVNPAIFGRLRPQSFDAVLIHGHNYFTSLAAILTAKLRGVPVIIRGDTHLKLSRPRWKERLRGPTVGWLYRGCDAAAAIGSWNAEFYRAMGVREERIVLVPFTVDNEFFSRGVGEVSSEASQAKADLGISPDTPVILFASKLAPGKRPVDLIAAFRKLRERQVDCALLIAGGGELEQEVQSQVVDLEGAHWLGFLNQTEMVRAFAMADVFVLPSENESFGLVVNEAMAAGLPVVTTDQVGAGADLVRDGVTGFVYPVGDIGALSDKLDHVLQNRAEMSRSAKQAIDSWSLDETIGGIREALALISQASGDHRKGTERVQDHR